MGPREREEQVEPETEPSPEGEQQEQERMRNLLSNGDDDISNNPVIINR